LETCDFALARDEIADFFKLANAEANREGGEAIWKTEFVRGWEGFSTTPNSETARAWLGMAPEYATMIMTYLADCCPGGGAATFKATQLPTPADGIRFVGEDGFYPAWAQGSGRWIFQRTLISVGGPLEGYAELVAARVRVADSVVVWAPLRRLAWGAASQADLRHEYALAVGELLGVKLRCYGSDCLIDVEMSGLLRVRIPENGGYPEDWRLICPRCGRGQLGPDLEPVRAEPLVNRWRALGRPSLDNPGAGACFASVPRVTELDEWIRANEPSHLELAYLGQQMWPDLVSMFASL
jgi:hypothetical protein